MKSPKDAIMIAIGKMHSKKGDKSPIEEEEEQDEDSQDEDFDSMKKETAFDSFFDAIKSDDKEAAREALEAYLDFCKE